MYQRNMFGYCLRAAECCGRPEDIDLSKLLASTLHQDLVMPFASVALKLMTLSTKSSASLQFEYVMNFILR